MRTFYRPKDAELTLTPAAPNVTLQQFTASAQPA